MSIAVVVGVLAIFAGLVGISVVVAKRDFSKRRAIAELPKARLLRGK